MLSLDHEEPDRIPTDCWVSRSTRIKIEKAFGVSYEGFLDRYDVDLRYIEGPDYVGPPLKAGPDADDVDVWGVPRKLVHVAVNDGSGNHTESYKEVFLSPLASCTSVEQIHAYDHWPSVEWFDFSPVEDQCDRVREHGRVVVFMGDRLNRLAQLKPAMYLRGTEQIMIDLAEQQEIAEAIFRHIRDFYVEYGRRILEAASGKIDIFCTGDDFGSQTGLLISPRMWDRFLRPGFTAYIDLGQAYGARVMHHTCGAVRGLMPRFAECGLDILQSLQPEAAGMDPRGIKRDFGDRLSFQGGISIQRVLPRGSIAEIRRHVREVLEAMAPGGGYIAGTSHNIQADVSPASIECLFEAYRDFGRY
jgi:uroporphyrinogen decarboxylase